jgi:hypothetical protein
MELAEEPMVTRARLPFHVVQSMDFADQQTNTV